MSPLHPNRSILVALVILSVGILAGLLVNLDMLLNQDSKPMDVAISAPTRFDDESSKITDSDVPAQNTALSDSKTTGTDVQIFVEGDASNPFSKSSFISSANQTYYGILYFESNALYTSNNSKPTPSASVIKVFIMEYAYSLISSGELSEDTLIAGQSLLALMTTMIQDSNNQATNTLIDELGMERINNFCRANGYGDTSLQRHMLDNTARNAGLDNFTSLDDCLSFLTKLYQNRGQFPHSKMLQIMEGQNIRTKIPILIPNGTLIANKTGELDDVENDIGIIFKDQSDFAIVALTYQPYSSDGARQAVAGLAKAAFDH